MRHEIPTVLAAALTLAACGGQGHTSTSAPRAPSAPVTTSVGASHTTTTTAARVRHKPRARPARPTGPELPASYTLEPGGALSPSQVSAPAHTPILITVSSAAGSYHVALGTPQGQQLTVAPGHPGHVLLIGLRNGSYAIEVDGHPRGQLIVGVAPGP